MSEERRLLRRIVRLALAEDHVRADVTTNSLRASDRPARARVVAKAEGVISGLGPFRETLRQVDRRLQVVVFKGDGASVAAGDEVLEVRGRESSILRAERTALNFLQRLSGVATLTRRFVEALAPTGVRLLDTRKTAPGMRLLEKRAVRDGGGSNHRLHLADMALIKDNHIAMAGSITAAVRAVRRRHPRLPIEVEVKNLAELEEALALGVPMIMLDNFAAAQIAQAVALVGGRAKLEISGNVTLQNVAEKARAGVDFISVGALTHSAPALDLSLAIIG